MREIAVHTDDGVAPCWVHGDGGPGVLLFPDAGSVRAAMHAMAERCAALGYVVLLPQVYYRSGAYEPLDARRLFADPAERERMRAMARSLGQESAMRDARHYLAALRAQPGVAPGGLGCFGYCMGGRLAFAAAGAYPDDVAAAASIHGGGLVTDGEDSPHRAAARVRAALYFAVADDDPSCTPEQQGALVAALAAAHARFAVEHFAGARHGFAVEDFPVYDRAAAERHWDRVGDLFARALGAR